jgi:excisionase family DNA binding protein
MPGRDAIVLLNHPASQAKRRQIAKVGIDLVDSLLEARHHPVIFRPRIVRNKGVDASLKFKRILLSKRHLVLLILFASETVGERVGHWISSKIRISCISSIASISSSCHTTETMSIAIQEPITLPQTEQQQGQELERMLHVGIPALISSSGERIELPNTIYEVLMRAVELMVRGQAITLVPDKQVVTTQRAADLLGMSRPFFVKLLEAGVMAHHRVGNQRRVYLKDVLQFAKKRDQERQSALDRLTRDAFEAGLYERTGIPEGGTDE